MHKYPPPVRINSPRQRPEWGGLICTRVAHGPLSEQLYHQKYEITKKNNFTNGILLGVFFVQNYVQMGTTTIKIYESNNNENDSDSDKSDSDESESIIG